MNPTPTKPTQSCFLKKASLLMSLLMACQMAMAQHPYHPMAVEGNVWHLYRWDYGLNNSIVAEDYVVIREDTIVAGITYKKVCECEYNFYFHLFFPERVMGYIRDDSLSQQVFGTTFDYLGSVFGTCAGNFEHLMYDFKAEKEIQ
jgi:hypothetical protein